VVVGRGNLMFDIMAEWLCWTKMVSQNKNKWRLWFNQKNEGFALIRRVVEGI
jgi:hypothetical protein